MVIFRVFLNKMDTLNLSYFDQRSIIIFSTSEVEKIIILGEKNPQNQSL